MDKNIQTIISILFEDGEGEGGGKGQPYLGQFPSNKKIISYVIPVGANGASPKSNWRQLTAVSPITIITAPDRIISLLIER